MKKFYLLIASFIAMFGFMLSVSAAEQSVSLECGKYDILIGETTNCAIKVTSDVPVTSIMVQVSTSRYLKIDGLKTQTGWTADASQTTTTSTSARYAFTNATGVTGTATVFSFNITLDEGAKNITEGECGQMCISWYVINNEDPVTVPPSKGVCVNPSFVEPPCEDCDPKNPETGAFMNYIIIAGIGVAAIATMFIIRRTNKFYRV